MAAMSWNRSSVFLWLIVGGGAFGYIAVRLIHDWLRLRAARSWPSAEATIESAGVGQVVVGEKPEETPSSILTVGISSHVLGDGLLTGTHGVGNFKWFVRVAYSFNVGGEYHSGYSDRLVSSEQAGNEYARELQGKKFPVRYQPGNPEKSVVLDEEWITAIPSETSDGARALSGS
jgi:hypothetical protein